MKILKPNLNPETPIIAIAAKIRVIRQQKGLSKIFMAKSLDISVKQYAKLESGQTVLWLGRMFAICELPDIVPMELLDAGLNVTDQQ
ncbi:MAG: helix-turn-helix transcriptional regulator [Mucilaginibacter sp.]|nr:helix-turn-helix transcriptional regulator [Mucilaginibacter sp.]